MRFAWLSYLHFGSAQVVSCLAFEHCLDGLYVPEQFLFVWKILLLRPVARGAFGLLAGTNRLKDTLYSLSRICLYNLEGGLREASAMSQASAGFSLDFLRLRPLRKGSKTG